MTPIGSKSSSSIEDRGTQRSGGFTTKEHVENFGLRIAKCEFLHLRVFRGESLVINVWNDWNVLNGWNPRKAVIFVPA